MDTIPQKQLLINLKQMIEVSQSRGCWKAPELRDIGITYNNLCNFIKSLENIDISSNNNIISNANISKISSNVSDISISDNIVSKKENI